jgi:hypothetical protein
LRGIEGGLAPQGERIKIRNQEKPQILRIDAEKACEGREEKAN